jgi:hypothetical protein
MIVELKRFSVNPQVEILAEQGRKYLQALKSVLEQQNRDTDDIEVVFVLGAQPKADSRGTLSEDAHRENVLDTCNGRVVLYHELIENAINQYSSYLDENEKIRALDDLIKALSDDADEDS